MKKYFADSFFLRLSSPLILVSLLVICACRGNVTVRSLCACVLGASCLLLFYPLSFERIKRSYPFVTGQSAVFVFIALSPEFAGNECMLITASCMPALVVYTLMRTREKYSNVKLLFRVD